MKTATKRVSEKTAAEAQGASARGRARNLKRCTGRAEREVQRQLKAAIPHIVKASVDKAKEGSLTHTKWLWTVAEKAGQKERNKSRQATESLAALLMEQLREQQQ